MKKYWILATIVVLVIVGVVVLQRSHKAAPVVVSVNQKRYEALGDSVAAGVGLKDYSDASACDRTNQSYPNVVAKARNYMLANIACSGASLPAGILGPQEVNKLAVSAQAEQLFAGKKPDVVSLTIGANDVHWTDFIQKCYISVCGTAEDSAALAASLQSVDSGLRTFMTEIQEHYGSSPPKVVVTGYYQVFPSKVTHSCADLTGIDGAELAWGRTVQGSLSDTLKNAVSGYSFAAFVPVDFSGHELCTTDPWVQGLGATAPYHPTAAGQKVIANQVVKGLGSVQ